MAILEVGINLASRNILEIKYYSSSDGLLEPQLRGGFLTALERFTNEVFGGDITEISLASFKLVCYCEMITLPSDEKQENIPLLFYAIIDKGTDIDVVKDGLKKLHSIFIPN